MFGKGYDNKDWGTRLLFVGSGKIPQSKRNGNGALLEAIKKKNPVRVIRGAGSGKYAPESGFRYDGIMYVIGSIKKNGKYLFELSVSANTKPLYCV